MKCPYCNHEMIQIPDMAMWLCKNDECITPPKEEFYVSDYIAIEWQARAEKAESELKAIRNRIEAIKELPTTENGHFVAECRWNAGYNTAIYDCKELIKQIGGVK